jgi:signal transduction histidine kinase/tetratricopeptide (TPR) repeat protein
MKLVSKNFSFLKNPVAIILFGLFFTFFIVLLNYDKIENRLGGPSEQEIKVLDSLTSRARDMSRIDPKESLVLTLEVLAKSQKSNYQKGLGDSYRLLALASVQARNFVLTKEYIQKAKEIYIELGDDPGLGDIENTNGSLYIYMADTMNAIGPYRKAYEIYTKLNRTDRVRVAAFNLAFSYSALPNLDSSKYFLEIAESLKTKKEDVPGFGVTQGLRGKIAYLEGDFGKAKQYFQEALDYYYANQAQESFVAFFESTLYLAKMYEAEGDIDAAKEILTKGISSESIYLSESLARQIYIDLIKIYESKGDYLTSGKIFWEKEKFEAELERRKVEQAKNFSAELTLYKGFQIENEELSSRLSTVMLFSIIGGVFTFFILILFLRVIFLNQRNKELKILVDKSFQIAQIGTFEVLLKPDGRVELLEISDIIYKLLAINSGSGTPSNISLERLLDLPQQEKLQRVVMAYSESNDFFKEEFDMTNLAGERRIVRVIARVINDKRGGVTLKGILLDITSEHQVLEQTRENLDKEKNLKELREQLMHMTSHEFRTPLSNISSSIELISLLYSRITQEDLQFRFKTIVQNARGNITRLVGMLDDLLLYERVQSDEFEVRSESFNLKPYLESLITEVKDSKNSDAIVLLMIPDEGVLIQSDRDLLHHIFTNLIGNAIKYLDKKLPVEFEVISEEKQVHFRIKDYGIGIPEKDMEKLFTPFKRASNVGGKPGTGLGLSIVKRMVTKLGGNITVTSTEGEFTEFLVSMPK